MINTKHYVLLAGDPVLWDAALEASVKTGVATLTEMQERQYHRGFRSAVLVDGVGGWYVRSASNLDDRQILASVRGRGGQLDGSREAAIKWGRDWANSDPANREFFAAKRDLGKEKA